MLEVEQKFKVPSRTLLTERLTSLGATSEPSESHADTYYRHPCRDFVETGEAFRIRKINEVASITYKGPKLRSEDQTLKARKEIEWCLAPGDSDGSQIQDLLESLGFSSVTTVQKQRESFHWPESDSDQTTFTVTIDEVQEVGLFAEIELLVSDQDDVRNAGDRIAKLATDLGLNEPVRESYLEMLLAGR